MRVETNFCKKTKNNKNRKKITLFSTLLCFSVLLTGCGSNYSSYDSAYSKAEMAEESYYDTGYGNYDMEEASFGTTSSVTTSQGDATSVNADMSRKLIRNVDMSVETKTYDSLMSVIQAQTTAMGGYIENSYSYNGSAYNTYRSARNASLVIRIPAANLDAFLNQISNVANVTRKTESVSDITLQYVDVASHKDALTTEQTRLLELLSMAENLEEILVIEDRLTEIRYQLQSYESQLRTYDNQVNYSTVTIEVEEVKELTPVEPEDELNAFQRMGQGFVTSLSNVIHGVVEFIVWFVSYLPVLLLWAAIIAFIIWIVKKIRKPSQKSLDRKARREAKAAAKAAEKAAAKEAKYAQNNAAKQANNAETVSSTSEINKNEDRE